MNLDPLTLLTLATVAWWGRWLIGLARADWLPEDRE